MRVSERPITENTIHNDQLVLGTLHGTNQNDHIIHHRDPDAGSGVDNTGLYGGAGDDILESSVASHGQIHIHGGLGDDWFVLDVSKNIGTNVQGHHAYGGPGSATYQFTNIANAEGMIVGRLDTFAYGNDQIRIEDTPIDLKTLPQTVTLPNGDEVHVRVIELEQASIMGEGLGPQQFLAIGDNVFYALEGARELGNGELGNSGNETHFVYHMPNRELLREAEPVDYVDPQNYVPTDFYEHREDDMPFVWRQDQEEVTLPEGSGDGVNYFSHNDNSTIQGSSGDDVINGISLNRTIHGGEGDDLIAGGIDFDTLYGDEGDDMLWGGDGNDTLFGGEGDDFLDGGRNDDVLHGGSGSDTLVGGRGDDILTGSGDDRMEGDINTFHFADGDGTDTITDFNIDVDLVTLQDDVDPATVRVWEDEDGNTVISYGEDSSVQLQGVSLEAFQAAAGARAEDGDDVITISPDPEAMRLEEIRAESGYYGDQEPPDLHLPGVQYGAEAFTADGPGGLRYSTAEEENGTGHDEHDDLDDDTGLPVIPGPLPGEEDDEEGNKNDDEDQKSSTDSTCFVATAAYADPRHPDVVFLRAFRDTWLVNRAWGRLFVDLYCRVGPVMARHVRDRPVLAAGSRRILSWVVRALQTTGVVH